MAPYSVADDHRMTHSPSSPPTLKPTVKAVATTMAANASQSALSALNESTPSPVMIQYVFVREPTAAPTDKASGRSLGMGLVAMMAIIWALC